MYLFFFQCPKGRQTLLFSATLTENVVDLVNLSLNEPYRIKIDAYESIVDNLQQEFIRIRDGGASSRRGLDDESKNKKEKDSEREREAIILALAKRSFKNKTIIFMQSKMECHRMSIIFGLAKLKAAELQGNMTQTQRLESLESFRSGAVDYLLCTDLAARGLDIPGVETVLNMSMPRELRQYIHRVGRTARAGRSGRAVTLVGEGQRNALKELVKKAKDVVHSRVIPPEVISRFRSLIKEMEGDIRGVFAQEGEEKAIRVAEMEANKLANNMRFSEEIHSRPAKTWFQTPEEKKIAKENSKRVFSTEDELDNAEGAEKPLSKRQLERAEAKLKKQKEKDSMKGLSRAKKRRKLMELEAKQAASEAIAEAKKHHSSDLRSQSLPEVVLPPSFEQQQNMQRVMGHKLKKQKLAEKNEELGIMDIKSKRREIQAQQMMKIEKKKGNHIYNDGSGEQNRPIDGINAAAAASSAIASSKKKPSSSTMIGSNFRYKERIGSGDDRFKMPHRKFKEEKSQRAKGESSAKPSDKKKGTKKATNSFKSKSKFKRR
jgi:ATP-dependent RNA helicase DDX27